MFTKNEASESILRPLKYKKHTTTCLATIKGIRSGAMSYKQDPDPGHS